MKLNPYEEELFHVMLADYGDEYKKCRDCGKPTHKRYICSHCHSDNP